MKISPPPYRISLQWTKPERNPDNIVEVIIETKQKGGADRARCIMGNGEAEDVLESREMFPFMNPWVLGILSTSLSKGLVLQHNQLIARNPEQYKHSSGSNQEQQQCGVITTITFYDPSPHNAMCCAPVTTRTWIVVTQTQ